MRIARETMTSVITPALFPVASALSVCPCGVAVPLMINRATMDARQAERRGLPTCQAGSGLRSARRHRIRRDRDIKCSAAEPKNRPAVVGLNLQHNLGCRVSQEIGVPRQARGDVR